jgi:hypothetical protein
MSLDRTFRIYLLAVCFVSVVCVAITAGTGLYSLLKIAAPEFTLDTHAYNAHQSNDNFRNSHFYTGQLRPQALFIPDGMGGARRQAEVLRNSPPQADQTPLPEEEVEQLRLKSYQMLIRNHQRSAMQELIRISIVLLVSGILFFAHWRLISK